MFTDEQLEEAQSLLVDGANGPKGKLRPRDVTSLFSIFREFVGYLEEDKGYAFSAKLKALDDTSDDAGDEAAMMRAGLTLLQGKQFKVGSLKGGRSGVNVSQLEQRYAIVKFLFALMYPIPIELSTFDLFFLKFRLQSGAIGGGSGSGGVGGSGSQSIETVFVP